MGSLTNASLSLLTGYAAAIANQLMVYIANNGKVWTGEIVIALVIIRPRNNDWKCNQVAAITDSP